MRGGREIWTILTDTGQQALGLVSEARALGEEAGLRCCVVLVTADEVGELAALVGAGCQKLVHLEAEGREIVFYRPIAGTLASLAREREPRVILLLSSLFGRAVAPRLAAELQTGVTADCTALSMSREGQLRQIRPTFAGCFNAAVICRRTPAIASVRPGVFTARLYPKCALSVETVKLQGQPDVFTLVQKVGEGADTIGLARASVIFAGGLGLGSRQNYEELCRFAFLTGATPAASRGAVAAGWAPYSAQVGQTGAVVRPRLYVAFGISGSVQHLSGMSGAERIVAVNTDSRAPIFSISDAAMVADCNRVIEAGIQKFSREGLS
ncbi:MAG: electron transfer flavoprotein subunit alpha/FixB family protein [Synergistaceae bacterium]|jgi:electron transfer flavoprotein alpha subunit|nr:electron transfer flavoprotein subunit alpha/FixB family protein [Synergistaceae bacterium]